MLLSLLKLESIDLLPCIFLNMTKNTTIRNGRCILAIVQVGVKEKGEGTDTDMMCCIAVLCFV